MKTGCYFLNVSFTSHLNKEDAHRPSPITAPRKPFLTGSVDPVMMSSTPSATKLTIHPAMVQTIRGGSVSASHISSGDGIKSCFIIKIRSLWDYWRISFASFHWSSCTFSSTSHDISKIFRIPIQIPATRHITRIFPVDRSPSRNSTSSSIDYHESLIYNTTYKINDFRIDVQDLFVLSLLRVYLYHIISIN